MKLLLALLSLVIAFANLRDALDKKKNELIGEIANAGGKVEYTYRPADILLLRAALLQVDEAKLTPDQKKNYENILSVFSGTISQDSKRAGEALSKVMEAGDSVWKKVLWSIFSINVWFPLLVSVISFVGTYKEHKATRAREASDEKPNSESSGSWRSTRRSG